MPFWFSDEQRNTLLDNKLYYVYGQILPVDENNNRQIVCTESEVPMDNKIQNSDYFISFIARIKEDSNFIVLDVINGVYLKEIYSTFSSSFNISHGSSIRYTGGLKMTEPYFIEDGPNNTVLPIYSLTQLKESFRYEIKEK
jgi:hypothetical protein